MTLCLLKKSKPSLNPKTDDNTRGDPSRLYRASGCCNNNHMFLMKHNTFLLRKLFGKHPNFIPHSIQSLVLSNEFNELLNPEAELQTALRLKTRQGLRWCQSCTTWFVNNCVHNKKQSVNNMQPGLLAFRHSCKKTWNADSTDKISTEFHKSKQNPPPLASYKTSAGMNFFLMTESLVTWDTNESNGWFPWTFSQFKAVEAAGVWGYVLI